MRRTFTQISLEEREEILELVMQRQGVREIARKLGRDPGAISRELRKNRRGKAKLYRPRLAQERTAQMRRTRGSRPRLKDQEIKQYVEGKLRLCWSPEQIAGRIRYDLPGKSISHEAIYLYIYAVSCSREGHGIVSPRQEDFRRYLRRRHKRRTRRNPLYQSRKGCMLNRVSIDQRPKYIEARRQLGHWEGDSIVSGESLFALNTIVERATGLVQITKLPDHSARATSQAVVAKLQGLPPELRRTLTLDNGFENAGHEKIARKLGTKVYFAHPYHSWERGTNENTNGLIRQYLPKGTDFATVPNKALRDIEYALNTRPRKRYKYKTPLEVLSQRVAIKG